MKHILLICLIALAFTVKAQVPTSAVKAPPPTVQVTYDTIPVLLMVSDTVHGIDSTMVTLPKGGYDFERYETFKSTTVAYIPGFVVVAKSNGSEVVVNYLNIYRKPLMSRVVVWNVMKRKSFK